MYKNWIWHRIKIDTRIDMHRGDLEKEYAVSMEKIEYLMKYHHADKKGCKDSFVRHKAKLGCILYLLALSCVMFLCGCGAKAAEDEIVMRLSSDGVSESNASDSTENEVLQQSDKNITTVSGMSATSELSDIVEISNTTTNTDMTKSTQQTLYIYICGAVENPGVYELEAGSRLYEAVEQAGGLTESADETCLNLARQVIDGEQVVILTQEQTAALEKAGKYTPGQASTVSANATIGTSNTTTASTQTSKLVNINSATVSELTSVSGIGESRAQAIIAYREKNGSFRSIEDIKKVDGIKEGLFAKIKDKITV